MDGDAFQSTLPARGATNLHQLSNLFGGISIHAPCTGSDQGFQISAGTRSISIHAPCTGSDRQGTAGGCDYVRFQSTLPARGATLTRSAVASKSRFQSTLPARGATPQVARTLTAEADFNPRSLHGERPRGACGKGARSDFNPRSLHGERRKNVKQSCEEVSISIHAPCTGSDRGTAAVWRRLIYFNPRSLHGERPTFPAFNAVSVYFNPRSLHGERLHWLPPSFPL